MKYMINTLHLVKLAMSGFCMIGLSDAACRKYIQASEKLTETIKILEELQLD